MKNKILYFFAIFLMVSCQNQEVKFPDFDHNAVYFPLQYPVRTLSLGDDDRVDNTLDKELKFHIGVSIGGMYNNTRDWKVDFTIDQSLVDSLYAGTEKLELLPTNYYQLASDNQVIIPKGSFNGLLQVQLDQSFLDNPKAIMTHYVIPLRIVGSDADSVLHGIPSIANADRRISGQWDASAQPKDFVLFGIKYVNKLHGKYLRRGKAALFSGGVSVKNAKGTDSVLVYRTNYIEQNQVVTLLTSGRNTAKTDYLGRDVSPTGFSMTLELGNDGNIIVKQTIGSTYLPTGTGKRITTANSTEEWGGYKREAYYLEYSFTGSNKITYQAKDTLVFRDRNLAFEAFVPIVKPKV